MAERARGAGSRKAHGRGAAIAQSRWSRRRDTLSHARSSLATISEIIPPVNNTLPPEMNRPPGCSSSIAVHCLYCKKQLPFVARILSGNFCGKSHRDSYLEALNRLGLARLVEARSWMTRLEPGEGSAAPQNDSLHRDLLLIQGQLCKEPPSGSRVIKRLKSESNQLIYDLSRSPPELVAD